jgi:hypothetical protein
MHHENKVCGDLVESKDTYLLALVWIAYMFVKCVANKSVVRTESLGEVVEREGGGEGREGNHGLHKEPQKEGIDSVDHLLFCRKNTHFASLLLFGRPVLTDTAKENNFALCQTPLSGICCLIWYGDFILLFLIGPQVSLERSTIS